MRYTFSTFAIILVLSLIEGTRTVDWVDYDEPYSNMDTIFVDDPDQYISALARDDEQEIHSPIITGYKYVSGGAGEGRQHLSPSGEIPNRPEVKTDEEIRSFCHPPDPCPLGFEADDCDASPMSIFTADYSRLYQSEQNCQCDDDHDKCSANNDFTYDKTELSEPKENLKRSRRTRRAIHSKSKAKNSTEQPFRHNPFHHGQILPFHIAKKSPNSMTF